MRNTTIIGLSWLFFCLVLQIGLVWADEHPRQTSGITEIGLPGIHRVGLPLAPTPLLSVSGSARYGMTESVGPVDGSHHQLRGTLGIGAAIIPQLAASLHFEGRYDKHPADDTGEDSSIIGNPRLFLRGGFVATETLQLGLAVGLLVPGTDAPSMNWDATTLDTQLLAAVTPAKSAWTVAAKAGFRWDNSANAAPDLTTIRPGDRMALGLSDFNALLFGLGTTYRFGEWALLGEVTADLLIGDGAPTGSSPIRIDLGTRYHVTSGLSLNLLVGGLLSQRPDLEPTDPLVPVEPRFTVQLGAAYSWCLGSSCDKTDTTEPEPEEDAPVEPTSADPEPAETTTPPGVPTEAVTGILTDSTGQPAPGIVVRLQQGGKTEEVTTDADGRYTFPHVPLGSAKMETASENFEQLEWTVDIQIGLAELPQQQLLPLTAGSQLRGLVRSFGGKPLRARITIQPGNVEIETDENGLFEVDLEPGTYKVMIRAKGYHRQHKSTVVEEKSVNILNVDLRRRK